MSILNSVLKVFVGDKNKKDLKALQPIIDGVRAFDGQMDKLSIDELRGKTTEFKQKIKEARKSFDDKIAGLTTELETANIDRKEEIYKEIDLLKENGFWVYGADMDENISPLEANLAWTVAWEPADRDFIVGNENKLYNDMTFSFVRKNVAFIVMNTDTYNPPTPEYPHGREGKISYY